MPEYDARLVVMSFSQAQACFDQNGDVSAIAVFISAPGRIDSLPSPITAAARPALMGDWQQRNHLLQRDAG